MGDAAKKPNTFELELSNVDRHVFYVALTATLRCPVCKSGPLDTTDPIKFLKFGKLWDTFKLSALEELNGSALTAFLAQPEKLTVAIPTDILRFAIETLLVLSNNLNSIVPALTVLNNLITIAKDNNIKLIGYDEVDSPTNKDLLLSAAELKLIITALLAPQRCENSFNLENGSTIAHGAPIDHPRNVKDFSAYYAILKQLNALDIVTGVASFEEFDNEKQFEFDSTKVTYLTELISRRSTSAGIPAYKFISIFNKLQELKN